MKMDFGLDDLTNGALKRLVQQLLAADDGQEKELLNKITKKPAKNDLADLDEEMHGKPNTPKVEEEDAFDLGSDSSSEDDSEDSLPPKKGKK